MRRSGTWLILPILAFLVAACGSGGATTTPTEPTPSPSVAAAETPTAVPEATPVEAAPRVGSPMVDAVLEAIARHDSAAIRSLLVLNEVPCSHNQNVIGAPPECPPGVAEGTPLPTFMSGACAQVYLAEERYLVGVAMDIASPEQQIFAVLHREEAGWTLHRIVLRDRITGLGTLLGVIGNGVTGIDGATFSCGPESAPDRLVERSLPDGWGVLWQRDP